MPRGSRARCDVAETDALLGVFGSRFPFGENHDLLRVTLSQKNLRLEEASVNQLRTLLNRLQDSLNMVRHAINQLKDL